MQLANDLKYGSAEGGNHRLRQNQRSRPGFRYGIEFKLFDGRKYSEKGKPGKSSILAQAEQAKCLPG